MCFPSLNHLEIVCLRGIIFNLCTIPKSIEFYTQKIILQVDIYTHL